MPQKLKIVLAVSIICFWFASHRVFGQQIQGVGAGGGSGTVTSVGLSLPSILTVTGSPVTTIGTLTGTLANQSANIFFGGPTSGAAAAPTFRALASSDLPNPTVTTLTASQTLTAAQSGSTIVMNCATACTVTLPTTPAAGTNFLIVTEGAANAAIALGGTDTYNLVASVPTLLRYFGAFVIANGAGNWTGPAPLVAGTGVTLTPASNGLTIAASGGGAIPVVMGGVSCNVGTGHSWFSPTFNGLSCNPSSAQFEQPVPRSGTVQNFCSTVSSALASGMNGTLTIAKNGTDTAITVAFTGNGLQQTVCDITHSFSVVQSDRLSLDWNTTLGVPGTTQWGWSFEIN